MGDQFTRSECSLAIFPNELFLLAGHFKFSTNENEQAIDPATLGISFQKKAHKAGKVPDFLSVLRERTGTISIMKNRPERS